MARFARCARALRPPTPRWSMPPTASSSLASSTPTTTSTRAFCATSFRTAFTSQDHLLTLALGAGRDEGIFRAAREAGVPAVPHGVNNNTEPTLLSLGRAGLLRPGDEYIHCTHMSDAAWKLIRDTGGHVSLAVPIEMAMGHGLPPIQDALDHGIRPSLSSDVDVTMAQDPFTEMRSEEH